MSTMLTTPCEDLIASYDKRRLKYATSEPLEDEQPDVLKLMYFRGHFKELTLSYTPELYPSLAEATEALPSYCKRILMRYRSDATGRIHDQNPSPVLKDPCQPPKYLPENALEELQTLSAICNDRYHRTVILEWELYQTIEELFVKAGEVERFVKDMEMIRRREIEGSCKIAELSDKNHRLQEKCEEITSEKELSETNFKVVNRIYHGYLRSTRKALEEYRQEVLDHCDTISQLMAQKSLLEAKNVWLTEENASLAEGNASLTEGNALLTEENVSLKTADKKNIAMANLYKGMFDRQSTRAEEARQLVRDKKQEITVMRDELEELREVKAEFSRTRNTMAEEKEASSRMNHRLKDMIIERLTTTKSENDKLIGQLKNLLPMVKDEIVVKQEFELSGPESIQDNTGGSYEEQPVEPELLQSSVGSAASEDQGGKRKRGQQRQNKKDGPPDKKLKGSVVSPDQEWS